MNIDGKHYRTIWLNPDGWSVEIIDQTKLPFQFETVTLRTLEDSARAIQTMQVRGAPLIGATAAYGVCLGLRDDQSDETLERALQQVSNGVILHCRAANFFVDARAQCLICRDRVSGVAEMKNESLVGFLRIFNFENFSWLMQQ